MEEGWERLPRVEPSESELGQLVEPAFPGRRVRRYEALMSGLANTNIRFQLEGDASWYVLRLHTRDRGAARRGDIASFLERNDRSRVPVAPLIYSDPAPERGDHPYSIWGFVEGTLLQALFEHLPPSELIDIAAECGRVLAGIAAHPFARAGELGPNLDVIHEYGRPSLFVPNAIQQALFQGRAGTRLGEPLRDELWRAVERTSPQLAVLDDRYALVHGDYKRSNLILQRRGSCWRVAAVLDWEFAFAGPPLVDVGLFLRAGAALPEGFREAFASAYTGAGGHLPADWLPLSRLIDALSQVTFLDHPRERPRVFAESIQVLQETLRLLA